MPEFSEISVSDLLLDVRNARLKEPQSAQPQTILALAKQQGPKLQELAHDVVEKQQLDPLSLFAVVPAEETGRYIVLEGNRRLATLKGLDHPSLVTPAFDKKAQREWNKLAERYSHKPIEKVRCAIFQSEGEAVDWIRLRHTGQNAGRGLVDWGADEKDRFSARHGERSPAGQIIDFVNAQGLLSETAKQSGRGIITNLTRAIVSRDVRETLGIEIVNKKVVMQYPAKEVARSLTRLVEDFLTGEKNVGDIYSADKRTEFANAFPQDARPDAASRLPAAVPLGAATSGKGRPGPKTKPGSGAPASDPLNRERLIPATCTLKIGPTRIAHIEQELRKLEVDRLSNAASVLLRVFTELSIDHYGHLHQLYNPSDWKNNPLAKRMKVVAADLKSNGVINSQLEDMVIRVADSKVSVLAASVVTFNQFVHNQYVFPKPTELKQAWDELQPLFEAIWT